MRECDESEEGEVCLYSYGQRERERIESFCFATPSPHVYCTCVLFAQLIVLPRERESFKPMKISHGGTSHNELLMNEWPLVNSGRDDRNH